MSTDVMTPPPGTSTSDDLSDPRLGPEIELRDLVYQTLERDGLITRMKAQLRAAVFTTIEKSSLGSSMPSTPSYEGMTGRVCRALVLDWLEHSHLFYTEDVFKVETAGAQHPAPLTRPELLEQLHMKSLEHESQPILHALLQNNPPRTTASTSEKNPSIDSLPLRIKQSIDQQFPSEKIGDLNRLRVHFRSLFSATFDASVLDAYLSKNLSATMTKKDYEQACLKWIQACTGVLTPSVSTAPPTQSIVSQGLLNTTQVITPARRSLSPPSNSSSSSESSSESENSNRKTFGFPIPTTMNKPQSNKSANIIPPPLIDFDDNDSNNEEDEDTSASVLSKRNATPAALGHLKTIDKIIQGDETPRTRTTIEKLITRGINSAPVEYDDESFSQSQTHSIISSVDDVTVDKASPSPSAHIDYLDDF